MKRNLTKIPVTAHLLKRKLPPSCIYQAGKSVREGLLEET